VTDMKEYFAATKKDAEKRYEEHKDKDPFPEIDPALLSSAHIQAYIAKTGMIYPYFPSINKKEERITSASLTLTIGSEVLFWDNNNKQQYDNELSEKDMITLRPNSITFLRPAERFQIPDYIAIRFNLRIVHVHRGLLLGTGPLLDPGFKGFPMIPVHNLTDNEYQIRVGDEFINVEFTKISNIKHNILIDESSSPFTYKKNRGKTFDFQFIKYIDKNVPQRRVKSSLSGVIDDAKRSLKKSNIITVISILTVALSIAALVYGGYQLTISTTGIINDTRERLDTVAELQRTVAELEKKIDSFETKQNTQKQTLIEDPNELKKKRLNPKR